MRWIGNWEPLIKALEHIIEHPSQYDQDVYLCDSTRCVAGWAVYFDGWEALTDVGSYVGRDGKRCFIDEALQISLQIAGPTAFTKVDRALFDCELSWYHILTKVRDFAWDDEVELPYPILREMELRGIVTEGLIRA
jgi:hypothetical protein